MVIGLRGNDPLPRRRHRVPPRPAVGVGGPRPEVGQDLRDHLGLLDECDDPHGSATEGTHQRVHLVHLFDEASPGAFRRGGGDVDGIYGRWVILPGGLPPLPPARIAVKKVSASPATAILPSGTVATPWPAPGGRKRRSRSHPCPRSRARQFRMVSPEIPAQDSRGSSASSVAPRVRR